MVELGSIGAGAFLLRKRADGAFVYADVNAAFERLTGLSRDMLLGRTTAEVLGAEAAGAITALQQECAAKRVQVDYETPKLAMVGQQIFQTTLTPLIGPDGALGELLAITFDVTERKRLEAELKASNLRLNLALDALGGANWTFDVATGRFELSPSFGKLLGGTAPNSMSLEEWQNHVVEADRNDTCFAEIMAGRIEQGTAEFRVKADNGETRWLRCRRRAVKDGTHLTGITGVVVDISSEKRQEAELSLQASSDALTGLANRRRFDRELAAVHPGSALAVLMIDVDQFKAYNDLYGHIAGDAVLKTVAKLIACIAEEAGGMAARYGGEEFAVLLPGSGLDQAAAAGRRILAGFDSLAVPHAGSRRGRISVSIGASAGRAPTPADATDLVIAADRALYRAKTAGRARLELAPSDRDAPGGPTGTPLRIPQPRFAAHETPVRPWPPPIRFRAGLTKACRFHRLPPLQPS